MPTYPNAKNWSVEANVFNQNNPSDLPLTDPALPVPVNDVSVTMPIGSSVHLGQPVDANLAVRYIRNFLDNYRVSLREFPTNLEELSSEEHIEILKGAVKKHKDLNEKIIDLNFGMTLEKDLALKILSQPKCEGLRFYLCAKQMTPGEDFDMSLIVVGVDCDGYDHKYNPIEHSFKIDEEFSGGMDCTTNSLTGEYVTPPNNGNSGTALIKKDHEKIEATEDDFHNRFVLLNMAKKLKPPVKPQSLTEK